MTVLRRHDTGAAVRVDMAGPPRRSRLGEILVARGYSTEADLAWALARQLQNLAPLGRILVRHGRLTEADLARALAEQAGCVRFDPGTAIADATLVDALGPGFCARERLVPLGRAGAVVRIAVARPAQFDRVRDRVTRALGPVAIGVMTEAEILSRLTALRRHALTAAAETRSPAETSIRAPGPVLQRAFLAGLTVAFALGAFVVPGGLLVAALAVALLVTAANTALMGAAVWCAAFRPDWRDAETGRVVIMRLPRISLIVPLLRETDIADQLVRRLARLDYPRELLDVWLAVEDTDTVTARTLKATDLPDWIRVVSVAQGQVQTKPRALNFALDLCDGAFIGIYDAEDAPAPDQLRIVVRRFSDAGPHTACLQGRLNFYNVRASWLTRCFCMEYSLWFSMVLPALRRLGWALPLGGTTVFFRRAALEEVGGWDAHNVTEDADLGIRLARAGYRTELMESTTLEEATCSPRAWIRQRSRWQKGYAVTWWAHMRYPLRLLRDLGPWAFTGFQVLFLGSLGACLVAPLLWSFWLILFGLPHPLMAVLPRGGLMAIAWAMAGVALFNGAVAAFGLVRLGRAELIPWIPVRQLYHPLATVSLGLALYDLAVRPYFWIKTEHGVSPPDGRDGAGAVPRT